MAKREIDPRLQELFNEKKHVYSISKCNTIDECLYEAYNAYVLHERGSNGIYSILGSKVHDCLESVTNGEVSPSVLPSVLEEELNDLSMLGIDFPKDRNGGDSIRNSWVADMKHFCENFVPLEGKFDTEELFIYQLNEDRYVQGYIDLIRHNDDGTISILDWKTSSAFSKEDLLHHGRQLILYAIAKEAEGFKVRDVAWYMLKYCEVSFMGKKRANSKELSLITKVVNRGKLVSELKNNIEYHLSATGYDEIDIECMLNQALEENSLSCLPADIQSKYKIEPHIRQYEITDELKVECIQYINSMADKWESLDTSSAANFPPRSFTKKTKQGKEVDSSYFCQVLCNYRNTCKYLKMYKEMQNNEPEDEFSDLF